MENTRGCSAVYVYSYVHERKNRGLHPETLTGAQFAAELVKGAPWVEPSSVRVNRVKFRDTPGLFGSKERNEKEVVQFPQGRYECWDEEYTSETLETRSATIHLGGMTGSVEMPVSSIHSGLQKMTSLTVWHQGEYVAASISRLAQLLSHFGFEVWQQHFWITPPYDCAKLARDNQSPYSALTELTEHRLVFSIPYRHRQYSRDGTSYVHAYQYQLTVSDESGGSWVSVSASPLSRWPVPVEPIIDSLERSGIDWSDLTRAVERACKREPPSYADRSAPRSWWHQLLGLQVLVP